MARELPRTLRSLAPGLPARDRGRRLRGDRRRQRLARAARPGDARRVPGHPAGRARRSGAARAGARREPRDRDGRRRLRRACSSTAPGSPVRACSPAHCAARRVADRPVVATLGWHLGPARHMDAHAVGYDRAAEDALLASLDWERDGYRLFGASTLAGSSARGWFAPMGESNGLFLPKACGRSSAGSTSSSRSRAAGCPTTICTAARARSPASTSSCCSARARSTRSTAARRRRAGSAGGDARRVRRAPGLRLPAARRTSRSTSGAFPTTCSSTLEESVRLALEARARRGRPEPG